MTIIRSIFHEQYNHKKFIESSAQCRLINDSGRVPARWYEMNFTTFKRSAEIPIPSVWRSFSKCTKEGKKLFFKVQDVTEELKDECLKHMSEVFLRDEHVFSCISKNFLLYFL